LHTQVSLVAYNAAQQIEIHNLSNISLHKTALAIMGCFPRNANIFVSEVEVFMLYPNICVTKWMGMFRYTYWVNRKECYELLMIFLDLRSQMWPRRVLYSGSDVVNLIILLCLSAPISDPEDGDLRSSETSVNFCYTTLHIQEDGVFVVFMRSL
jgi:hypothetical protein